MAPAARVWDTPAAMDVRDELEERVRAGGVRVEERVNLLRELEADDGPERVARRIEALRERIRRAADRVRGGVS